MFNSIKPATDRHCAFLLNRAACLAISRTNPTKRQFVLAALIVFAIAMTGTSGSAIAQSAPQYKSMEINERYLMKSLAPRLSFDRGTPVFTELTDDEKNEINKFNRNPKSAIAEDEKKIDTILQGSGDLSDPIVAQFFDGYVFAEMTQLDQEKISNLGGMRRIFIKDFLSRKVAGAKRQQFLDSVVIPSLQKIYLNKQFHPAARLNAVYLLGLLDSQIASRSLNQQPIPSATAYDDLIKIYNAESVPAYLKVGALAGIQRHVEFDSVVGGQISPEKKQALVTQAIAVLTDKAAGQDEWDSELNYWLKRRSVQILGMLKDVASLDTILGVMNSSKASLWLRFDALDAISRFEKSGLPAEKISAISLAVAELVANNLAAEATWINASVDKLIYDNMLFEDIDLELNGTNWPAPATEAGFGGFEGGMGGGFEDFGMSDMGDMGDMGFSGRGGLGGMAPGGEVLPPKLVELPNYMLDISRRRIKALAFMGKTVLKYEGRGLHASADAETKQFIDKIVRELDLVLEKSSIGIINLADQPVTNIPPPPPTKSVAQQLAELSAASASRLKQTIRSIKGDEAVDPLAAEAVATEDPATDDSEAPAATTAQPVAEGGFDPNLGN